MPSNPYPNGRGSGGPGIATSSGPQGVQRSYALQLKEQEPLFDTYEHLQGLPRGDAALTLLRKVASMVKPIMRKRGWHVQVLAEFLPPEQNLLGLNINKGYKICIRLRYPNNPDLFLPIEQIVDTMLHELSHIVWGDHDSNFHKLWDELRDEYEVLVRKGYTGEGFLSEGKRLGGSFNRMPPPHEMRRLARASAEKRKAQGTLSHGSGQRLGGTPLHLQNRDIRQVIADQATRRNQINRGCASGRKDAGTLSDQSSQNTFKTKAEEDDANNRAIAQALFELMEQEEAQKLNETFERAPSQDGLGWSREHGLYDASLGLPTSSNTPHQPSEDEQMAWALRDSMASASSSSAATTDAVQVLDQGLTSISSDAFTAPPIPLASKPSPSSHANRPVSCLVQEPSKSKAEHQRSQNSAPVAASTAVVTVADGDLIDLSEEPEGSVDPDGQWACQICTCINPMQYLACDACGCERSQPMVAKTTPTNPKPPTVNTRSNLKPHNSWDITPKAQPETLGWTCKDCGAFMEHKWWTCSACGLMKSSS